MQSVDRSNMERKDRPWRDLFESHEERKILAALSALNWQPEASYSLLKELLSPIIHFAHFNSHSRWGLQIDSQEIRALALRFHSWMNQTQSWVKIQKELEQNGKPSSLKVLLSRCFARFRESTGLKTSAEKEPSYSARRTLLELPQPQILVSGEILDAFASLTSQLPKELRLPYQMHLEGLVDEEISALLDIDPKELQTTLKSAKTYMKDPGSWKNAS